MSDRIAVMNGGRILQIASPDEIYHRPTNRFVARFIDRANVINGEVVGVDDQETTVRLSGGQMVRVCRRPYTLQGTRVGLMIRAEKLSLGDELASATRLSGKVIEKSFLGSDTEYLVELTGGEQINVHDRRATVGPSVGDDIAVSFSAEDVRILQDDANGELELR